jgi:hypothetical protein
MAASWRDAPFRAHVSGLQQGVHTDLPFVVAGATQQGLGHQSENQNNQDALGILIEPSRLFGLVADGCSGTDPSLASEFSNNEVGAKLSCWLLSGIVRRLDIEPTDSSRAAEIVSILSERYLSDLGAVVNSISGGDSTAGDVILRDCFTTTLLGFLVWEESYLVFRLGDGFCTVNGTAVGRSDAGQYLSSALLSSVGATERPSLQLVQTGKTSELHSIFLATDGVVDHLAMAEELRTIVGEERRTGWAYVVPRFRVRVLSKIAGPWPDDDASFLILRRIDSTVEKTTEPESRPEGEVSSEAIPHQNLLVEDASESDDQAGGSSDLVNSADVRLASETAVDAPSAASLERGEEPALRQKSSAEPESTASEAPLDTEDKNADD